MTNIDLRSLENLNSSIPLQEYQRLVAETDKFPSDQITPILLGLYGEVGSIMSASKKYRRERKAYPSYRDVAEEEFGDALWYFSALCRRYEINLADVFEPSNSDSHVKIISASDQEHAPISYFISPEKVETLDKALINLGFAASQLLILDKDADDALDRMSKFAQLYLQALRSMEFSFAKVLKGNLVKVFSRFSLPNLELLPDFDISFPDEEQLPKEFEVHFTQRKSGQCWMRWNGVFIGSPLTDNIVSSDGYRFHDVFHIAYAAVLHWSPTFRALIKHKRKSDKVFDEAQDGGRAIVVEEGLTAWLFSYSKGLDYFEGHDSISFDVLKIIQKFVVGYEVEKCPLKLWEDAILQGYSVFRQVKKNNGGIVVADRARRKITYKPVR